MNAEMLKELGLDKASERLEQKQSLKDKLMVAYEHYRVVTPEIIERFQVALKEKTKSITSTCYRCFGKGKEECFSGEDKETMIKEAKKSKIKAKDCGYCQNTGAYSLVYDTLVFVPLKEYPDSPPPDCLLDLRKAHEFKCFDEFEVAKVKTVEERPDPIIFGRITGSEDRFFVTQWDDDVRIEDILRENEG